MNKEEALKELIKAINNDSLIERLHLLETVIDKNPLVNDLFDEMHEVERKLVNARYYKKNSSAEQYEKELESIKERIEEIPFLDEYLELLDMAYNELKNVFMIIENDINNCIK